MYTVRESISDSLIAPIYRNFVSTHVGVKAAISNENESKVLEKIGKGMRALGAAAGLGIRKCGLIMISCNIIFWSVIIHNLCDNFVMEDASNILFECSAFEIQRGELSSTCILHGLSQDITRQIYLKPEKLPFWLLGGVIEGVDDEDMIEFWITAGLGFDRIYRECIRGRWSSLFRGHIRLTSESSKQSVNVPKAPMYIYI